MKVPEKCMVDSDCRRPRLCHVGTCTKLDPDSAILEVLVVVPGEGAMLIVDDTASVSTPWEGIVPAGPHQLKIWASGYESIVMEGNTPAGMRTQLTFSLTPNAPPPILISPLNPPQSYEPKRSHEGSMAARDILEASDRKLVRPFLYLAGRFHGSVGVAMWGEHTIKKQLTFLGGMEVGMRFDSPNAAFDLGISAAYGDFLVGDIEGANVDYARWNMLLLGLVPRFSFPLRASHWFAGFELELGYVLSTLHYGYAALRGHLAYAFHPWLELRLNLLGADWMQELSAKAAFVSYNGNVAFIVRFR